jgi:DNA mismatch endonuclease (patch repair protein)
MLANKRRDTKPELAVRALLHARGLRYRVDFRPLREMRNRADVVFTRAKVALFVDGCFWHGCPDHYWPSKTNVDYWTPKIAANQARDCRFDARLRDAGWTVLRAWEHEDPTDVADRVEAVVRRPPSTSVSE